jgi:phage-related protein
LVLKNPDIYDTDEMRLTGDDVDEIRAWLESPKTPAELHMMFVEDSFDTYYFGIFTDVQPYIFEQDCYGLYLTFTCNAPYGFSPYVKNKYVISNNDITSGSFYNNSSEKNSFVKPLVTIYSSGVFNGSEKITIQNKTDNNNSMVITLPKGISKLIIDTQKKQITDQDGNLITMSDIGVTVPSSDEYNFISAETYLFYWFRLAYGANQLLFIPENNSTITTVEISARHPRKSGGF